MIDRKDCDHPKLQFGSGDFYLFCHNCGAIWATITYDHPGTAPELSNHGIGSSLSGQTRSK